jgi:hypothetical protein
MSTAIPCNGVLNSLISKKKSLILENNSLINSLFSRPDSRQPPEIARSCAQQGPGRPYFDDAEPAIKLVLGSQSPTCIGISPEMADAGPETRASTSAVNGKTGR